MSRQGDEFTPNAVTPDHLDNLTRRFNQLNPRGASREGLQELKEDLEGANLCVRIEREKNAKLERRVRELEAAVAELRERHDKCARELASLKQACAVPGSQQVHAIQTLQLQLKAAKDDGKRAWDYLQEKQMEADNMRGALSHATNDYLTMAFFYKTMFESITDPAVVPPEVLRKIVAQFGNGSISEARDMYTKVKARENEPRKRK
jgi:DNA repair exonuclease SbcCD ATPase subunit